MIKYRDDVLHVLRAELFGPAKDEEETVTGRPLWRYLCGMLFPVDFPADALDEDDEKDPQAMASADEQADPAVALAYDALPSSMGISFFLSRAKTILCEVEGARYSRAAEDREQWQRKPLSTPENPAVVELNVPPVGKRGPDEQFIWDGLARVVALFRPRGDGHLVTVSLVNAQKAEGARPGSQIEQMLFQCRFRVRLNDGAIGEYPTVTRFSKHPEDEELAVAYRRRSTYAVGHGCAAMWDAAATPVRRVEAEPMPVFEVKGLTTEIPLPERAAKALNLRWLSDPATPPVNMREALQAIVEEYRSWIETQEAASKDLPAGYEDAAKRMLDRQHQVVRRMEKSIETLFSEDEAIFRAFRIAQQAMLAQFLWAARRKGPRDLGDGDTAEIDIWDRSLEGPRWRPFQLAFQLVVLDSLARPESAERNLLDLLWFPTGGGKTEAYLALAAFEIVLRRLRHGEAGGGTAVLMRYTLRLLTSQQFERAATLISVLETMRRTQPDLELGDEPIRLGLWVGGATTPNALDRDSELAPGARQVFDQVLQAETPDNPFQLRFCPHCSTRIVPRERSSRRGDYGIHITATEFRMFCPDDRCILHGEIPVSVIDDDLTRRPPTFLIGTIDKFARMVWDASSRVFFGTNDRLPPSLIVQDELHLITGPLGTIAGVYEAAIDTVLSHQGTPAKYIAATATIQRAQEQSRSLYARDACIFPPPGLDASDSFFSREDTTAPGRTFVGLMGHGMYSALTSLIQVSAAAASAAASIPREMRLARDSYWTQVIYHNSRQELGKTTTTVRDDVRNRLLILQPDDDQRREFDSIEELSANLKGSRVSEAIEGLQVEWPKPDVIDAVACTNMISVGVDIARLGLMIVKGQPKSTAEYIQATSRVGRDLKRPPGIVLTVYAATRPRDRSHYETFQSDHMALYRAVEPATVTPYSPPARDRALHAALVLALRHVLGWIEPRDASQFDVNDPQQSLIVRMLKDRCLMACRPDERDEVAEHLKSLTSEWSGLVKEPGPPLSFSDARQFRGLLAQFPSDGAEPNGRWPTLNSMRHVDGEVQFSVRGQDG